MSRDLSCRPHELLKLRIEIEIVVFRSDGDKSKENSELDAK